MKKTSFIKFGLATGACTFLGFASCQAAQKRVSEVLPNVVVILTDDQGWGDLSCSGNVNLSTPNIDQLSKSGARFDRFYVSPVCSPTRAELLTGRYHPRTGVYRTSEGGERMDLDEVTIADLFKKAGYTTAAFGKWHNGMQYPYHPNARGFDEFYGFCSGHWGDYYSSDLLEHNGQFVTGKGYITDDLTDHAVGFIEQNKSRPFFLYVPYNSPHTPMQVPDKYWNRFKNKQLKMHHRDLEQEDIEMAKATYAMVENIDDNVGRIMEQLVKNGLLENTIVVFFSDNGPDSFRWNGGMKGKKGSTDEGGVRSPLFISWKGVIAADTEVKEISAAIDLLPTLTDLAGINTAGTKSLDGISLMAQLTGEPVSVSDRMVFSHWGRRTSVRWKQYQMDYDGHLFDLHADPGQYRDVAVEHPKIAEDLSQALKEWKETVLAELPKKDKRPIPLGHPEALYTQLPARDGVPHGNVVRSSLYPNCSYLTNWTSADDQITWDVEVIESGDFEVTLYYTCSSADVGAEFTLKFNDSCTTGKISNAWNPPLVGAEHDRVARGRMSYVKDFTPLKLPRIHLEKGLGKLVLQATNVPGSEVMDFRTLNFKRITRE